MNLKKLILTNLPYVFAVWPASKIAAAVRLSPGEDLAAKLFAFGQGFEQAFADWLPSLHPTDLCIGLLGALLLKLAFYLKSKNAKNSGRALSMALPAGERLLTLPRSRTRISFGTSP